MISERLRRLWAGLASLQLTLMALALLMVLVFLCTLAQTDLGTFGAVSVYMHSWVVRRELPGIPFLVPVFPGGALVGLLLLANLVAALVQRFRLGWAKAGVWAAHLGLILLVAGEFSTGLLQVETNMSIEEGQTVDFLESPRLMELVVTEVTDPGKRERYGIPEALLKDGAVLPLEGMPLRLRVVRHFPNARLAAIAPGERPLATAGVGTQVSVAPAPLAATETERNLTSTLVEPLADGASLGTWLVSAGLGAQQGFAHQGRQFTFSMVPRRTYLPYSLTLKKFSHDVYPGTNIPKNFSSLVRIDHPGHKESRDVLIFMNQPLRYEGRAFYQASFGKQDTLSILQVVENPGWLMPYLSCTVITLGLLFHFALSLGRALKRRQDPS